MSTDSNGAFYLMRTWYKTDAGDDPEYVGAFSHTARLAPSATVVRVDWSERGVVEVTYMLPGKSPVRD